MVPCLVDLIALVGRKIIPPHMELSRQPISATTVQSDAGIVCKLVMRILCKPMQRVRTSTKHKLTRIAMQHQGRLKRAPLTQRTVESLTFNVLSCHVLPKAHTCGLLHCYLREEKTLFGTAQSLLRFPPGKPHIISWHIEHFWGDFTWMSELKRLEEHVCSHSEIQWHRNLHRKHIFLCMGAV